MIRAIDKEGNIYGSLLIDDKEQLAQELACQLQLFKGENPFNLDEGIDWDYELANFDQDRLTALVRDRILTVKNVSGVLGDIVFTKENKQLFIVAEVQTSLGIIPIEIPIDG